MVAVAIAAAVLGCLIWLLRGEGILRTPLEHAPSPRWGNADHDVFDVVLSDMLANTEFGPQDGTIASRFQIVFDDKTYGWVTSDRLQDVLGARTKDVPAEAQADLVDRNPETKGYSLAQYRPSNPNILVQHMSADLQFNHFDRQFPGARGYILPLLPGYSRDGRMSLFYFYFGPTPHGAAGYYLLRKVNGRWEPILHGFYQNPHES
jgi:hypothetical protein